jgi:hypothetical protein
VVSYNFSVLQGDAFVQDAVSHVIEEELGSLLVISKSRLEYRPIAHCEIEIIPFMHRRIIVNLDAMARQVSIVIFPQRNSSLTSGSLSVALAEVSMSCDFRGVT